MFYAQILEKQETSLTPYHFSKQIPHPLYAFSHLPQNYEKISRSPFILFRIIRYPFDFFWKYPESPIP